MNDDTLKVSGDLFPPKQSDPSRTKQFLKDQGVDPESVRDDAGYLRVSNLMSYTEQAKAGLLVSHNVEQRVLAVLKAAGGSVVDKKGRVARKLVRMAAVPISLDSMSKAIYQLVMQGRAIREINGKRTYALSLVDDSMDVEVDQWAMDELWTAIRLRQEKRKATGFDKPIEVPKDWRAPSAYFAAAKRVERAEAERAQESHAVVEGSGVAVEPRSFEPIDGDEAADIAAMRYEAPLGETARRPVAPKPDKQVIVNPAPEPEEVAEAMDYGKLADALLVKVMAAATDRRDAADAQREVAALRRSLDIATKQIDELQARLADPAHNVDQLREYAYAKEQEFAGLNARYDALDANHMKVLERCAELETENKRLRKRLNGGDRSARLGAVLDDKSKQALAEARRIAQQGS